MATGIGLDMYLVATIATAFGWQAVVRHVAGEQEVVVQNDVVGELVPGHFDFEATD